MAGQRGYSFERRRRLRYCRSHRETTGLQLHALSFRYGQRHEREMTSAQQVAAFLQAKTHRVLSFDLRAIGGSALTDDIAVPKGRSEAEMGTGIPVTYVPARNTIFFSFALALAERIEPAGYFFWRQPTRLQRLSGLPRRIYSRV